ncbi:C-X-C motif chemokine 13 [Suricata suricatta]|uniref:C-X-C motif chemokine n=1 Tax=Suricata suricatta TaxID=37032 RepID=A0A673VAR5_SURSU|nr:C-X-C motif chemokine 13 [Suricata suricatta]
MRFSPGSLLFVLLVCSIPPVHGVLEAYNTNLKCKCIRETSAFIPPNLIEKLEILPPGNGCPNKEVIVKKKNMSVVCLNPRAKWVPKFINILLSKRAASTPSAPVFKKRVN